MVRAVVEQYVDRDLVGDASYEKLVNMMLADNAVDPAVVAGYLLLREGLRVQTRVRDMNHVGAEGMRLLGVIRQELNLLPLRTDGTANTGEA